MEERNQDRILRYLQDAIAAERNFESALKSFSQAGDEKAVQRLMDWLSKRATTQGQRLTALLESRGGSPSPSKAALARMLTLGPLSAPAGRPRAEKNTQHLIVTLATAAGEMAMYQALASVAEQAGDQQVLALARSLQSEEEEDYGRLKTLLPPVARGAFQKQIESGKDGDKIICRYLEDAIAAEQGFEAQLQSFARREKDLAARNLFLTHAAETRDQFQRLGGRLRELGGSPSAIKSVIAQVFAAAPRVAQIGSDPAEVLTQNLMVAYSVENAEIGIYDALAEACRLAGDDETEKLALSIQQQEQDMAGKIWTQLDPAARRSLAA